MTSDPPRPSAATSRRNLILAGASTALVIVAAVALALTLPAGSPGASSPTTPSATTPASDAPTPVPSESPTPVTQPPAGDPVPIDTPAEVVTALTASISGIEAVDGVAKGPGEVSGPSIRFTVTIANATGAPVDLTGTVVTVDYGADRTPAGQLYEPGAVPLATSVAAGGTASGVFVFAIPPESRGLVHITVDYAVDVAPLVFAGATP
ncbi:MAG TPA: hypothetical protein VL043_03130 [Protaetiibacter sp.]|nr:hypothetical protein [Protaetiibacter sp.]